MNIVFLLAILAWHPVNPAIPGQIIDITAGDYFFQAPATARPGLTTIRIHSLLGNHLFQLYRIEGKHSAADLASALRTKSATPWARDMGGAGVRLPGETASATYLLEPGKYAILCPVHAPDLQRHYLKGMYAELTVSGARVAGKIPKPDLEVTATDFKWTFSKPLTSGRHVLRFTNAGKVTHELKFIRNIPGSGLADIRRWKEGDPPLKGDLLTLSPISPGVSLVSTIDLPAGEYNLWCIPQAAVGMIQPVRVR